MTTHKLHIPHWHRPDWHTFMAQLGHLVHDVRFWAVVAVAVLFLLLIIASLYGSSDNGNLTYFRPFGYPAPYWP